MIGAALVIGSIGVGLAAVGLVIVFWKFPALIPKWRGWTWDGEE